MQINVKLTIAEDGGIRFNHYVKFDHNWAFWLAALCLLFIVSIPFSLIGMFLVGDSPFWMWQLIGMFFASVFFAGKR